MRFCENKHGILYWPRFPDAWKIYGDPVFELALCPVIPMKKGGQLERVICFSISHTLVLKRFSQQLVTKHLFRRFVYRQNLSHEYEKKASKPWAARLDMASRVLGGVGNMDSSRFHK